MKIADASEHFAEAELSVDRWTLDPVLELWGGFDKLLTVRLEPVLAALVRTGVVIGVNQQRLEELAEYLAEEK